MRWSDILSWVLLGAPALLLLVPAGLALGGGFDGLYGQDAYAYYDYAVGPVREAISTVSPLPSFFWPPGYPLLVALVSFVLGVTPLAGQLVSLVAGASVPAFTMLLAREVWDGETLIVPTLAGVLVALTGQLWQSSIVSMADTTGLAAATLGVWALARYGRPSPRLRWLILASAAMAFAILTRWVYALVAIPCALYVLVVLVPRWPAVVLRHSAVAMMPAGVLLWPLWEPLVTLLVNGGAQPLAFVGDLQVYSWQPLNAIRRVFVTGDGLLRYRLPNGLYYALLPAHPYYLTPAMAALVPVGVWSVFRRRADASQNAEPSSAVGWTAPGAVSPAGGTQSERGDARHTCRTTSVRCPPSSEGRRPASSAGRRRADTFTFVLGWAGIVYTFHAGVPWQNFRFPLAYTPPLAILAAIGAGTVWRRVQGWRRRMVTIYLGAGLIWAAVGAVTLTNNFIAHKNADLATVHWVEAQVPADARLLTFGLTLTFQHESSLETHELFTLTPEELVDVLGEQRPAYLLLDVRNVRSQWQGRSPDVHYTWLRDGPGLEEVGRHRKYTLFRIGR